MIFLFFALYFIHSFIQPMFIEDYCVLDSEMGTLWGNRDILCLHESYAPEGKQTNEIITVCNKCHGENKQIKDRE